MDNFQFDLNTEIFFGKGQIAELGKQLKRNGAHAVLVCYGSERIKQNGLYARVMEQIESQGLRAVPLGGIQPNPRIAGVREGVRLVRENSLDFILAVGGGSVIDAAKAVAAGVYYEGDPWELLSEKAEIKKAVPLAAILTLAATGSEMNGGAVISNPEIREKLAMISPLLRPRFSILDPENTFTVSTYQTAAGAADIMSHVFEQYFSPTEHTGIQDRISEAILTTVIDSAPLALKEADNYQARANLMWAGTLALNGLLSAGREGDWATHMIEHAVSALYDVAHGAGLAIIFPNWMKFVLSEANVDRFYQLALRVWGVREQTNKREAAEEGIARTRSFFNSLKLPSTLKEVGAKKEDIPLMAEKSMQWEPLGSFGRLDQKQVEQILELSY